MPELPEVETARRCLEAWARGRRIAAIHVAAPGVLEPRRETALDEAIGARFTSFDRRGKHLLLGLARGRARLGLWSHLGMTGKWLRRRAGDPPPRFSRVRLALDRGGVLHYCDLRLFGRMRLVPGADFASLEPIASLGPDPLADGIAAGPLAAALARLRAPIKVALLDQRLLAGVGNIQASEGLFRARLDPRRPARSLDASEVRRLARGLGATLRDTLAGFEAACREGDVTGDVVYLEEPGAANPFRVYGKAATRCPACGEGAIERLVQAGRSTFFCPRCQR